MFICVCVCAEHIGQLQRINRVNPVGVNNEKHNKSLKLTVPLAPLQVSLNFRTL